VAEKLSTKILKGIRGELQQTNRRLDGTNQRLDGTNQRLEDFREELSRRIVESEARTATALTDLAGTVREMTSILRASHDLRPRVELCEQDIADLKRKVG
jgi:signal transduction histidine kinase